LRSFCKVLGKIIFWGVFQKCRERSYHIGQFSIVPANIWSSGALWNCLQKSVQ
jgi:hypothetical protein